MSFEIIHCSFGSASPPQRRRRRTDCELWSVVGRCHIFRSASLVRDDCRQCRSCCRLRRFNPRPRMEGDYAPKAIQSGTFGWVFRSTPSVARGRHRARGSDRHVPRAVSIRAPLLRADTHVRVASGSHCLCSKICAPRTDPLRAQALLSAYRRWPTGLPELGRHWKQPCQQRDEPGC